MSPFVPKHKTKTAKHTRAPTEQKEAGTFGLRVISSASAIAVTVLPSARVGHWQAEASVDVGVGV
eukprot:3748183-Rhodomonas_salina.1